MDGYGYGWAKIMMFKMFIGNYSNVSFSIFLKPFMSFYKTKFRK